MSNDPDLNKPAKAVMRESTDLSGFQKEATEYTKAVVEFMKAEATRRGIALVSLNGSGKSNEKYFPDGFVGTIVWGAIDKSKKDTAGYMTQKVLIDLVVQAMHKSANPDAPNLGG